MNRYCLTLGIVFALAVGTHIAEAQIPRSFGDSESLTAPSAGYHAPFSRLFLSQSVMRRWQKPRLF